MWLSNCLYEWCPAIRLLAKLIQKGKTEMTTRKNIKTQLILSTGLAALLGAATLGAQNSTAVADVPFAFHAEQETFSAGKYQVAERISSGIFQLTGPEGKSIFVNAPVPTTTDPQKPHLTFARYGGEYVLSAISMSGKNVGHAVSQSAIEKNLTHKLGFAAMVSVTLKGR
jgi:hypothetical protein